MPPHAAHAAGSPQFRHTRAMPAPGSGAYTNARRAPRRADTSRGARPSGPGRTTSTGGHHRADAVTSTPPRATASADGHTADIRQTPSDSPARATPTSRTWKYGDRSSRWPAWLSRETYTKPRSGTGAKTAGRVPTTTGCTPSAISNHVRYRARFDPPAKSTASLGNASSTAAAVAGNGSSSGTSTSAPRPLAKVSPTASTATTCSSAIAGRTTNSPLPRRSASSSRDPFR